MSYIEREAAYAFLKDQLEKETGAYSKGRNSGLKVAMSAVMNKDAIPAADVRPVVLCRDCHHRDPEDHKCDCGQLERAGCVFPVDDDYFCAYGAKREESRAEMRNRRIGND